MNNLESTGQNVRKVYQRRLPSDPTKDYYFIHRNTGKTQPIIVEYGFLDSKLDDVNQLKNNYETLAEAVVKSLVEYIGANYTSNTQNNLYTVKSGDTLWNIAKKYDITVNELKQLNNLSSNSLKIGQKLKIPNLEELEENTYIVKFGDTLYSIANKYNISVDELKKINNLTTNNLKIGQILTIVPKTINQDFDEYTVKSGDTLYNIANKYNISVQQLKSINNLEDNNLSINQILLVPKQEDKNMDEETNYIEYIVKKGDNLYSIANRYNITQQEIMDINNLKTNLLSIGQILKIPAVENNNLYTVKSGDTLYSIARNYNTTVADIINKNNLLSNNLSTGQILIL